LNQVKIPLDVLNVGKFVLLSLGLILIVICVIYHVTRGSKRKDAINKTNSSINNAQNEQTPLLAGEDPSTEI
jgi:hypothetical protein